MQQGKFTCRKSDHFVSKMGLKPLEFSACYLDSPYFRDNVYEHERELERTNENIKGLIKECKNLMRAVDSEFHSKTNQNVVYTARIC